MLKIPGLDLDDEATEVGEILRPCNVIPKNLSCMRMFARL